MNNILVVAFDGMDRELIEDFGLDAVKQKEFGSIDNDTGIKYRSTSELFASFITGDTYEEHGVINLLRLDKYKYAREGLMPDYLTENVRGFWKINKVLENFVSYLLGVEEEAKYKYTKKDLKTETIFDKIDLSKPLFVPSYNPDGRWQLGLPHRIVKIEDVNKVRNYSKKLTRSRLNDFYELNFEFWDLVFLHLHDPDAVQDVELGNYKQDYERLDQIAKEIVEEFSDEWTIIFMSDHGLKQVKEHNKNAFYSCNEELFGGKTPHITDFYDKILSLHYEE